MTAEQWELAKNVLTEKQFQVLELRERHGFSWPQISYALDIEISTARGLMFRATRNLGRALRGGSPSAKGGIPSIRTEVTSSRSHIQTTEI